MQDMVRNWFKSNELYYDELIFSTVNKLENCRENNIDIMIEDSPHNIKQLAEFLSIMCFDTRYNKEQSWIYLVYKGNLESGQLKIAEPDKCLGYERYKIGEVDENELSNGAKELYRIVSEKYSYLK